MKKWQNRAKDVLAQGSCGTNSKRPSQYVRGVFPEYLHKASECYVWDLDNKRYIDFVGGLGTIILGYDHPKVREAVEKQLKTGYISGSMPTTLEVETAELISNMFPTCQRIRFLKTGSEACAAAVRIARAHTNKLYLKSDGYHGHNDIFTSLTPPALGVRDDFKVVKIRNRTTFGNVAASIVEPFMLEDTDERKSELADESEWIHSQNGMMIFDEVVTGCRVDGWSVATQVQDKIDVDIQVLGKAIANGFPLSVVGGKKDVMDSKEYFISSTFSGEAMSLAACKATLEELRTKSMKDLIFYAKRFRDNFNEMCKPINVEMRGYGTRGMLDITNYHTALLAQECCKGGILFGKAFFYHFGHLESGIEEYVFNIISDAVNKIKGGFLELEGDLPRETFAR